MSYTAEVPVYVGASSLNFIAKRLMLPEMIYVEKECIYYYTAKEIKEWYDYDLEEALIMLDRNLEQFYTFCCYRDALQSHATNYISNAAIDLKIVGKKRKNELRKITKKYRFILS